MNNSSFGKIENFPFQYYERYPYPCQLHFSTNELQTVELNLVTLYFPRRRANLRCNSDAAYLLQVHKPLNQVLSSMVDQDVGQVENHNLSADELQQTYSVEEFEIRILEPEKSGGPWQTRATIAMQSSENALTIRVVTLLVSSLSFFSFPF